MLQRRIDKVRLIVIYMQESLYLWTVLNSGVHLQHIYIKIGQFTVCEWQKQTRQISLDGLAFTRLDTYKLYMIFWTCYKRFNVSLGLRIFRWKSVEFTKKVSLLPTGTTRSPRLKAHPFKVVLDLQCFFLWPGFGLYLEIYA